MTSNINKESNYEAIQTKNGRSKAGPDDSVWKSLYKTAALAALIAAALTPILITVFIVWPPPYGGTAHDWFTLFQDNPFLGLVSLDLFFVVVNVLMIPIVLGLYVSLRKVSPSVMAIAATIFFVGLTGMFASNPSVEMLSLSNQYAAANTEVERVALLGGAEALLASFEGTAFHVYYILGQIAGILMGVVMLGNRKFGKWITYSMVIGNVVGFGLYIPTVGLAISALSGVILWIWIILIGFRFLQFGRAS